MKIGIKLLLLGIFVAFSAVAFSQTKDEGGQRTRKYRPAQMQKLEFNKNFIPQKRVIKLESIPITPSKAICPRKPISK